ncbi:unnamed protein product [Blumeria hordei]|uniref:Zinc finger ZPR1-type domain-containing protein n=2 Tax=Blumeria hordei TaxID=2867405 RepID=A0A383V1I5_BLUHO|nr:Zinc finger protein ZPR1 [Blumeria hordei DH14]SZF05530.1 unnamed protein product [Blumeria hordei]
MSTPQEINVNAAVVKAADLFPNIGEKTNQLTQEIQTVGCGTVQNGSEGSNETSTEADQRTGDEVESLCMNCYENGITRLLLTRIPYFREIILMSFECPHCHFKNSEIRSAGEIQTQGCKYELRLTQMADFARQVVKSDTGTVKFIELDLEIPAGRGQLTNMEGLLSMTLEDLARQQPDRKVNMPQVWSKLEEIIATGRSMLAGAVFPFRVELDDPAGNSWIEPDHRDGVGKLARSTYARTPEQNAALGLGDQESNLEPHVEPSSEPYNTDDISPQEVYSFPASCPGCVKACVTHMKMVEIPHFQQVIIMSTVCDHCGYRSNEVKTGGAVPARGQKITLHVRTPTDLARDILKSESCALECPELSLAVNPGTLGGRFTTVEGLLTQMRDDLRRQIFDVGDSQQPDSLSTWQKFFEKLDSAIQGEILFTLVMTDPLASSYVQNLCAPNSDPQLEVEDYERTKEEEDDLGLSDMKTENYSKDIERIATEKKGDLVEVCVN